MKIYNIFTDQEESLPNGKADFLLAASLTKTSFTQGGVQNSTDDKVALTPALDAEFVTNEKLFSSDSNAWTDSSVLSPAVIVRAVHNTTPFSSIEVLDLGLLTSPQNCISSSFGFTPSESIELGAGIDAKDIFAKGMQAGEEYELKGNYLILAQSVPGGNITAEATALALGYECRESFSLDSSNPSNDTKKQTIEKALSLLDEGMDNFEKLSSVSDNMLIFCAGFIMSASRRFHIVLAGGMQMAVVLLIADALREELLMRVKDENITLVTTSWMVDDKASDIKQILSMLSYTPHALQTSFTFQESDIDLLKKYDEGEIKDGVGLGAALAYANTNKTTNKELLDAIEYTFYTM